MSDLYLILRRRLEEVTDWVTLGTDVMKEARRRAGFSYETLAGRLHVAAKTYERYEKAGRLPRQLVSPFARETGLELEEAPPGRLIVPAEAAPDAARLARLERMVAGLQRQQREALELLRELRARDEENPGPQQGTGRSQSASSRARQARSRSSG